MKVHFLDLLAAQSNTQDDIEAAARHLSRSRGYVLGPKLSKFETKFAKMTAARSCIGVENGLQLLIAAPRLFPSSHWGGYL